MKTQTLFSVLIVAFAVNFSGCASFNPDTAPVTTRPVNRDFSLEKVHSETLHVLYRHGWGVTKDKGGEIDLYNRGQTIRVSYTDKKVSIRQTGGNRDISDWIEDIAKGLDYRMSPLSSLDITQNISLQKIHLAILNAAIRKGWQMTKDEAEKIDLLYKEQSIQVTYTTKNINIFLIDGDRDLTGWIRALNEEIKLNLNQSVTN